MSKFQKIYDEEFYLMFALPSQAGRVLAGLLKHAQNKDTQVKNGYRIKSCYPSQTSIAAFFGVTERTVRKGVKQLQDHGLLECKTEGRRNIYTIFYPIGMDNLQEYLEKIQDQMNLCHDKIQDQVCNNIGSTVSQIQDQVVQQYRIKCDSKKQGHIKKRLHLVDTKGTTEQMSKEQLQEHVQEHIQEKQNNDNKPKFFYIPEQGGFSDWRK